MLLICAPRFVDTPHFLVVSQEDRGLLARLIGRPIGGPRCKRVTDIVLRVPPLSLVQIVHEQASHTVIEVIMRIRRDARIARMNYDIRGGGARPDQHARGGQEISPSPIGRAAIDRGYGCNFFPA